MSKMKDHLMDLIDREDLYSQDWYESSLLAPGEAVIDYTDLTGEIERIKGVLFKDKYYDRAVAAEELETVLTHLQEIARRARHKLPN